MRILIFFVYLFSVSSVASDLQISGEWIQGGLLKGKTSPANKVIIFDRDVYVSEQGEFVFGLGRDTPNKFKISVKSPSKEVQDYFYDVKQRQYPTQKIEGVAKKYVAPPKEVTRRIQTEAAQVKAARKQFSTHDFFTVGFKLPLKGPITGVYGSQRVFNGVPKRPHYGLDIAGPLGAVVKAPAAGIVRLVHEDMYYSGGTLIIDHGQGISSTFIHLSKILVSEGDMIGVLEPIAEVGATGRVTGPHLDWRINWFNQRLDPALSLPSSDSKSQ